MATVNFINRKKSQNRAGMKSVLDYTQQEKKTLFEGGKLVTGVNCSPASVYQEFINTKLQYRKDSQRMYYHFVQSFPPNENITPQIAHEIALKLAEHYKEFEVLVATHVDCEHIHSHFIINSVSFETGKKLHQPANAIQQLRQKSDNLCREYGLSICQPKASRTQPITSGEYHSAVRSESWKMQLINTIDTCMRYATSKEMLFNMMESKGYSVKWTDSRKNITYTTPCGKKCRDDRLHEEKYLKEMMEFELRIRNQIITGRTQNAQSTAARTATSIAPTTQCLSAEAGGSGRTVLLNHIPAGSDQSDKIPVPQHADSVEFIADTGTTDSDQDTTNPDSTDIITGWEAERAFLFSAENQTVTNSLVTDVSFDYSHSVMFVNNLVQLRTAVERAANTVPIINGATNRQPPKAKERKLAPGQKEDDHSGYEYEMKL